MQAQRFSKLSFHSDHTVKPRCCCILAESLIASSPALSLSRLHQSSSNMRFGLSQNCITKICGGGGPSNVKASCVGPFWRWRHAFSPLLGSGENTVQSTLIGLVTIPILATCKQSFRQPWDCHRMPVPTIQTPILELVGTMKLDQRSLDKRSKLIFWQHLWRPAWADPV